MRILYFDIDCLRPDHLGCYGYDRPTSPNIDRVAQEGIRFNHYYCATSPCLPSRTAMLTGRYGIRNGTVANHGAGARLHLNTYMYGGPHADNELFVRQLRRHDIDTYCFSTFADRHSAWWWQTGWTEFHTPNLKGGMDSAGEVNEKVLSWLERNSDKDHYYMHINYWDVHRTYKHDSSWAEPFKDHPVTTPWPDQKAIDEHQAVTGPFTASHQPFWGGEGKIVLNQSPHPLMADKISTRADYELMVTGYDAMIRYIDHHIGQVLDKLEQQGHLKDTAVIISADHGDAFGEHGIYTDHVNVDECIHRIPLVVRWPGQSKPATVDDALMTNVDFAPTICDLLDVPAPEQWDGKSYKANLCAELPQDRDHLVWESGFHAVQRAVRTKDHLYIRTYDSQEYNNWQPEELYDMKADPYQTHNLAQTCPDIVASCRKRMSDWVKEQKQKPGFVSDPIVEVLKERGLEIPPELKDGPND